MQSFNPAARAFVPENVGEVLCGNVSDYAVGDVKTFAKGRFFVVRHEEGFIALSRWCTHRKGLLTWKAEHWCFYCPMHGATYDRKGENTSYFMKVPPLLGHPLSIAADGTITVRPDEAVEREAFGPEQLVAARCATTATAAAGE